MESRPQPETIEVSTADKEVIDLKYKVKETAMAMIKADNTVTVDAIAAAVQKDLGVIAGKLTAGFVDMYVQEAHERELIDVETFDSLKTFVSGKEISEIREIR